MRIRRRSAGALLLSASLLNAGCDTDPVPTAIQPDPAPPQFQLTAEQEIGWIRQFGSAGADAALEMAADPSGLYVVAHTSGTLAGQSSSGFFDAFVRKHDHDGAEVWTRQFGGSGFDNAAGVAVYGGSVYVAGSIEGTLPGQSGAGGNDVYLRKYDLAGNEVWTRQFGSATADRGESVAVDASGIYVAGITVHELPGQTTLGSSDAFLRKYDLAGNELWTRQFGTSSVDQVWSIALTDGAVYVGGATGGTFPGQTNAGSFDGYVRKYDVNGNELWTRQFGSSGGFEPAAGIAVDANGVYVAGTTNGALPGQTSAGDEDAYVRRYDHAGNEVWTRQFGTPDLDGAFAISVDETGIFIGGRTFGLLPGQSSPTGGDAFVRKYDFDGTEIWTHQFGSTGVEETASISAHASGVYVAGFTTGTLPGQVSAGGPDAYIANVRAAAPAVLVVDIDVRPGSLPNPVNPKSGGVLPVAVLATADFDPTAVDPGSVRFGRTGTEAAATRSTREDVDADGDLDLLLFFRTQDTGIACGSTSAVLTGLTADAVSIEGTDAVVTVGCR